MNATRYDEYRPLEVHVSAGPDEVRVAPAGEVDLASAGLLRERIGALHGERARLVLDLRDVSFMDSTGVRLMLDLAREATGEAWELSVINVPSAVHRVFELCGVLDALRLGEPEVV